MPRRRWIKLWTQETLYGTTSEELELDEQAIWFKLLALAGDSPEPGKIEVAPGIPMTDGQIAGTVKAPLDVWLRSKQRLQAPDVDKIYINEGIINIRNWDKYQSEFDRAEYMRRYMRDYRKSKTNSKQLTSKTANSKTRYTDQNRTEEEHNNTATTSENLAKISKLYEENIGMLTPAIAESLKDIDEKYPPDWFEEALKESVKSEHRNLKYISAILERWRTEGFKAPKKREFEKGGEIHGGTTEHRQHPKLDVEVIKSGENEDEP